MGNVKCRRCDGQLEAIITWVHTDKPAVRHEAQPPRGTAIQMQEDKTERLDTRDAMALAAPSRD